MNSVDNSMWRLLLLCLLWTSISTVLAQDPIVRITQTDPDSIGNIMETERDRDVTMSCLVENKQENAAVRWKQTRFTGQGTNNVQFNVISIDTSVSDNIKYSIEKPTTFTWRLRVKDTQVEDEGNYTCFVYTTQVNTKEANRALKVAIPPYLNPEQTSSDMTVRQADNIDLLCNATGRPNPTIVWTRLGGALLPIGKEVHFDSKLTILDVQASDRGTYRCRAFNTISRQVAQVIRDIQLDVRFPPIVTVNPNMPVVYQALGCYRIELQCYIEANPFPNVEDGLMWIKGSRVITESIGRYEVKAVQGAFNRLTFELIIHGVEEEDYGEYRCQIKNTEGTSMARIQLQRSLAPEPSLKLGRIIACSGSFVTASIATIMLSLALWLAQF